MYRTSAFHCGYAGEPVRMTHERSTSGSVESRKYCATCAFVRITPRGSIITPLADIGLNVPSRAPQRMLTSAARVDSLIAVNDCGGNGYGFGIRATEKVSDVVAAGGIDVAAGRSSFATGTDFVEELAASFLRGAGEETAELDVADWAAFEEVAIFGVVVATWPTLFTGCSNPTHCGCVRMRNAPIMSPMAPMLARKD